VKSALLRGREHPWLDAVDAVAEANAAIALSRGGAPKRYPHSEPNEDAAGFALGAEGAFVAVADGHRGFEGSEATLESLLGGPAAQWTEAPGALDADAFRRQALAALFDANRAVQRESGARAARTTVSFGVVLRERRSLLHAAVGDSHLFLAGAGGVREVAPAGERVGFLGVPVDGALAMAERARIGEEPLAGVRAVVLVTDGLSEAGIGVADPAAAVADAVWRAERTAGSPALELVRTLAESALAAHRRRRAGDNVAIAALWLAQEGDVPASSRMHR
jgi:serine/threonine protein phosphatase PrpC